MSELISNKITTLPHRAYFPLQPIHLRNIHTALQDYSEDCVYIPVVKSVRYGTSPGKGVCLGAAT